LLIKNFNWSFLKDLVINFINVDLDTVINQLESHLNNNRSTTLQALRSRLDLIPEKLVNEGVNAMMNIIFPPVFQWQQNSRPITPVMQASPTTTPVMPTFSPIIGSSKRTSTPILSRSSSHNMSLEEFGISWAQPVQARDGYENALLDDNLAIPSCYFDEEGKFPDTLRPNCYVPSPFVKDGKPMTPQELWRYFDTNDVSIFVNQLSINIYLMDLKYLIN
jgi:hypothetical protein